MSQPLTGHDNNMTSVLQTATGASYASGIAAFVGGLSLSDWLALFGACMVLVTYFTNLYFRVEERRRAAELHALKLKKLDEAFDDETQALLKEDE